MKKIILSYILIFFFCCSSVALADPVEPGKYFVEKTQELVRLIETHDLQVETQKNELTEKLIVFLESYFDWQQVARVSLNDHWSNFSDDQKQEFTDAFGHILKNLCLGAVKFYKGEKFTFVSSAVDKNFAKVIIKFHARSGKKVDVTINLIQSGQTWKVYDISVYGISLINNYRLQFDSVLKHSDIPTLIQKLKKKNKPLAI